MASDSPPPRDVPGLPPEVLTRVVTELAPNGHTILDHLRTAAALSAQARTDEMGLRLAESAAYNLREALDRVVEGRPRPQGGIGAIVEAWERYKLATAAPGSSADVQMARTELDAAIERLAQDQERQAYKTQKLLEYVRHQTGIEPLPGEDDPTVRYSRLRARANATLHEEGTFSSIAALYDETVAWFIRFFTPPDDRVRVIAALAERPYADGLVEELRERVLNAHHLRLFFSRVQDPSWLRPLHDAGLVGLPREGEPWPVTFLVEAGAIPPACVADVLDRLLLDSKHEDQAKRLRTAREILQTASQLGSAGHDVAKKVLKKYPSDQWVQTIAVSIAREADPSDPIQTAIADAILGNDKTTHGRHHARVILGRLTEGLTTDSVAQRMALVAAKLRRLTTDERMRFIALDIASLKTSADDFSEPVVMLSQHLASMIPIARSLGLPTGDLLGILEGIPGELGERITCQVLAGAKDVDREEKIGHIARRMASERATGDDRDLIQDILTSPLSSEELERWRKALGEPSPNPPEKEGPESIGHNWARAWRWSLVLPQEVLEGWEEAIEAVTAQHGIPSRSSFDTRISPVAAWGSSPYSTEELSALPVVDAAVLVSRWRPSKDDWGVSALELARSLEAVVQSKPRDWTEDPCRIVRTLREPVYVDHYFRGIKAVVKELRDRAPAVLAAVKLVRAERWQPTPLGRDDWDYQPDWSGVDAASVEMIGGFANDEGELGSDLDLCWEVSVQVLRDRPEELPEIEPDRITSRADDPLHRAINKPYGKALDSVLALGGWEHRNRGTASVRLVEVLNDVLAVPGTVGRELRSVLARSRPFLERVSRQWIDARANDLFSPDLLGTFTFEQTLKWSRPTTWFFERYRAELGDAVRRDVEHAVSWLLTGYLWDEAGYTFDNIIRAFSGDVAALRAAADEMASLLQDIEVGHAVLARGLQFWANLLDADRGLVPIDALVGLGRWTFVKAVDDERWIDLMGRTLELTDGEIEMPSEIADRCKEVQPSSRALRMLRLMIGHGEPWERYHTETIGVEALRIAARHDVDEEFTLLRTRLIERGRHEVVEIAPPHSS